MKHKHAELIHACDDGAEFEYRNEYSSGEISSWKQEDNKNDINWNSASEHRIKPTCQYALDKIKELGGDEAVELYFFGLMVGSYSIKLNCQRLMEDIYTSGMIQ